MTHHANLSSTLVGEFNALQRMYAEEHQRARGEQGRLAREGQLRRFVAYGFKAAAVLGGVAVAAGIDQRAAHVVGICIAVVIALDMTFSNQKRLLITVKASHGYQWSLSGIMKDYNITLKTHPKNDADIDQNIQLIKAHIEKTHALRERISTAINESDLKFLESIAVHDLNVAGANAVAPHN